MYGALSRDVPQDIQETIATIKSELITVSGSERQRIQEALNDLTNLVQFVTNGAQDALKPMYEVADKRIEALQKEANDAGVDASECFVDIDKKVSDATVQSIKDLNECTSSALDIATAEDSIVENRIKSALTTITTDETKLAGCNNDEQCLTDVFSLVTQHLTLPETLRVSIESSVKNVKNFASVCIKCDNAAISSSQYQIDGVLGLLDKCVHELIFH